MSKNLQWLGICLIVAVLQMGLASGAFAQATRTFVSGVGDDANPCSRTAPCRTFAGAISQTAPGGEINVLDPAGYGAVTITKPITITGDGTMAGVLVSGTNGIVVQAGSSDVVILRNLHFDGVGAGLNGIRFLAGGRLHVEQCEIRGFTQQAIDVAPTTSAEVFVSDTDLRNNGGGGIYVHPNPGSHVWATIDHVNMVGNGRGLRAEDGSTVVVRNSTAAGNVYNGFVAVASAGPADLTISGSVSSLNGGVGVYAGPISIARISNMTISGNNVGLQAVGGGSIISFRNNSVYGNNTSDGFPTQTIGQM